jgi:hypothetical protein
MATGDRLMSQAPGTIRDSIISYLSALGRDATLSEITEGVALQIGSVSLRPYDRTSA